MTKFISKSSNLLIVLRAGLQAQPITGTPATPTLSVRFKDGMAEVTQPEVIEQMLKHPGFGSDFISAEVDTVDPYAAQRVPVEPTHVLTEMKYGTPVARSVQGGPTKMLSPEMQKLVTALAEEIAAKKLPDMVKATLKGIVEANEVSKAEKAEVEEEVDLGSEEDTETEVIPESKPKATKKTGK
jgi:hypothetical protein